MCVVVVVGNKSVTGPTERPAVTPMLTECKLDFPDSENCPTQNEVKKNNDEQTESSHV